MADLVRLLEVGGDAGSFALLFILWQQNSRIKLLERKTFGF